jgi:hypothetical protein
MRDYAPISPKFWTGKTGKQLRGNVEGQLVALYLMTSPHANMIGIYHCPIMYIAYETGLTLEGASKGLQSLIESGFCHFDSENDMVFVVNMARHQVGDELNPKDNRHKAVLKELSKVSSNYLLCEFSKTYNDCFHLGMNQLDCKESKPLASPLQAPSKPVSVSETETVSETVSESDMDAPAIADAKPPTPAKKFIKPTAEELAGYASEIEFAGFNPSKFLNHYDSNGWMVGRNKMKDWKAAVRNWKTSDFGKPAAKPSSHTGFSTKNYSAGATQLDPDDWAARIGGTA